MHDLNLTLNPDPEPNTSVRCSHWQDVIKSWKQLEPAIQRTKEVLLLKETFCQQKACINRLDWCRSVCVMCRHTECLECANELKHYMESGIGHVIGLRLKELSGASCLTLFCFECKTHVCHLSLELPGLERIIRQPNVLPAMRKESRLRGILNLSNTCYMNAILQVLVHTPLLHDKCFVLTSPSDNDSRSRYDERNFLITIANVFREFNEFSNDPIVPVKLLAMIWEVMPHLAGNKQHDAHEFFISVLHALHLDFLKLPTSTVSLIDKLFLGRLQSTVRCNICGHTRLTVDPFWDISLEITPNSEGPIQLKDLLRSFTKVESLEVECQIQCPTCGKRTECTKQLKFQLLPNVICIHLKRFRHSKSPSPRQCNKTTCTKIETKIKFDPIMDFAPFKSSDEDANPPDFKKPCLDNIPIHKHDDTYLLYAVVKHEGTHESGHYYTYINLESDSTWYKGNDHVVTSVSRKEVMNTEAYLLFYKKFSFKLCAQR
ncbi:unnamed protein product [Orchesella dallaii]|uniref:USP domain-containing protein n=1 Tax=Orchesella dallaii TaxID=48710 RepID=A0ABP1QWC1_9HEXA